MYDGLNENQLFHYFEPETGLFIAESPKVIRRALQAGYEPVSCLAEKNHLNKDAWETIEKISEMLSEMSRREFHVYVCEHELFSAVTGTAMTRGMISAMRRRPLPKLSELLESTPADRTRIAVLEDVENPTNVGAIFRSAAALNMDAVLLTSTCSDPLYRRAGRVSMGCVFQIPWTYFDGYTPSRDYSLHIGSTDRNSRYSYVDELHKAGFKVCAMALTDCSVSISDPAISEVDKLAVILGNEGEGLPESTLEQCDFTVKIPMAHGVDSLNVAAASAVAFYALTTMK
ncbi:MAG: RNA methyltransferase [Lachnospiraceae bacterium]|nr:RNA methyltransferase [Lachnospiraceae bacterium]